MGFSGTQDKCKECGKTVHFVDLLSTDGVIYHRACFRCSHCKGTLSMHNYSSMDGVLYCKHHFEQLFKETGTFTRNFPAGTRSEERDEASKEPSRFSSMFSGTQEKCITCKKTAYPLETLTMEGESYHRTCFKCSVGGCMLTPASYSALSGILYCRHHFASLFMEKGTYSHVIEAAMIKRTAIATATATAGAAVQAES